MRIEGRRTNLAGSVADVRRTVAIVPSKPRFHTPGLGHRGVGVDGWSGCPQRVLRLLRVGSDVRVDVDVARPKPDLVAALLHVPGMAAASTRN